MNIHTVVFDIGGVLIDWHPRYLYRKIFKEDLQRMEYLLSNICTFDWNAQQDAGRSFAHGVLELQAKYPDWAEYIEAFDCRWEEMLGDAKWETVSILEELKNTGIPIYALTNLSAEKYPIVLARYQLLNKFDGILVSGKVGMKKPDPEIYQLLLDKYAIRAYETVFIDDSEKNIETARRFGMRVIHFQDALELRKDLEDLKLLKAY